MKIKGNNNTIIKNDKSKTVNNYKSRIKKITFWSILGFLITSLGWYFDYHKQLLELIGFSNDSHIIKKDIYFEPNIKPKERENKGVYNVINQLDIDFQNAKRINNSNQKDKVLVNLIDNCLESNRFDIAIKAAIEHSRKGSDDLLETIIKKALVEINYEAAMNAAREIGKSKKRKDWENKIKLASKSI